MRAKFIYEKFKQDSDPTKDMGIGLYYFDIEYFKTDDLKEEVKKESLEYKLEYEILDDYSSYTKVRYTGTKSNLIKLIKNTFYSSAIQQNIDAIKPITESLNEKFSENSSDPIKDLGIGKIKFIYTYREIEKEYDNDFTMASIKWREFLQQFVGKQIIGKMHVHSRISSIWHDGHFRITVKEITADRDFEDADNIFVVAEEDNNTYLLNLYEAYSIA